MKKLSIYIGFCAVLFSSASCKKFLEKNPDNRASLNTPEQVSQLLATAYPQGNYMAFCESASDNVADKGVGSQDRTLMDPFYFREVASKDQDSPENYFFACYSAIAAANEALAFIKTVPDPANYRAQKGEALVARAYAHFMLVTLFCNIYDVDSAETDLGIPYVTEPETVVLKQYDRKTVAYVYQMIEKDLLEGMPLLDDTKYSVPRYHFTRVAANAFACRFYLFKGDYPKVISYADQVFSTGNIVSFLRPWNTTYRTMTYVELFADYAKASEPANLLLVETASWWGRNYYNQRYGVTSATRDEILEFNPTGGNYAFNMQSYTAGTNNILLPKVNEYFVRNSINAQIGVGYVMVPLFTAEEVLFNRAEAYIYQNNVTATLSDLNTYASTRIINYNANTHRLTNTKLRDYYGNNGSQTNALLALLDFKRAEYLHEGMRYFDILRYHIPVVHRDVEGRLIAQLGANDLRRVFQLPESVSTSGMPLNPR